MYERLTSNLTGNPIRGMVMAMLLLLCIAALDGQIQYPGKPLANHSHWKAADVMYVLPPLEPLEVESRVVRNMEKHRKSLEFAIERPVSFSPEHHGAWTTYDHHRIWRIHIISPEALSMGLVFNEFALEPGVSVFVHNPDQTTVKGAFTSGNNKPSHILPVGHIKGDELIIEMQVPAEMIHYGRLGIESISHAYLDVDHLKGDVQCPPGEFGCSQGCEIDINCSDGDQWQLTKRSVVRIFTTKQYCTGVLVNNTAYDGTPYVLTAEHCINRKYYADRSVFVFNYESPSCSGEDGSTTMSLAGCDSMAIGDSIDFSLVRLSVAPPDAYDVYFAGWDWSDFQTTATTTIHHPWGDVKKISSDFEIPSIPAQQGDVPYSDLDDYYYTSFWWIRGWDIGSTEGGSSGAPLYNSGQRVIGVLSGGIARCGDSIGYDEENNRVIYNQAFNYDDYYTQMAYAWDYNGEEGPSLKPWLDPGNTGESTIGGYHPTGLDKPTMVAGPLFSIYPNPVKASLYFTTRHTMTGSVAFRIFDLSGNLQFRGNLDRNGRGTIDTTPLAAGIYLVRFESEGYHENHTIVVTR